MLPLLSDLRLFCSSFTWTSIVISGLNNFCRDCPTSKMATETVQWSISVSINETATNRTQRFIIRLFTWIHYKFYVHACTCHHGVHFTSNVWAHTHLVMDEIIPLSSHKTRSGAHPHLHYDVRMCISWWVHLHLIWDEHAHGITERIADVHTIRYRGHTDYCYMMYKGILLNVETHLILGCKRRIYFAACVCISSWGVHLCVLLGCLSATYFWFNCRIPLR